MVTVLLVLYPLSAWWSFGFAREGVWVGAMSGVIQIDSGVRGAPWSNLKPNGWIGREARFILRPLGPERREVKWWFAWVILPEAALIFVPMWCPLLLVAAPTVLAWRSTWRRRLRIGRCQGCGYDLTALPAAAVCPECGRART